MLKLSRWSLSKLWLYSRSSVAFSQLCRHQQMKRIEWFTPNLLMSASHVQWILTSIPWTLKCAVLGWAAMDMQVYLVKFTKHTYVFEILMFAFTCYFSRQRNGVQYRKSWLESMWRRLSGNKHLSYLSKGKLTSNEIVNIFRHISLEQHRGKECARYFAICIVALGQFFSTMGQGVKQVLSSRLILVYLLRIQFRI